MNVVITGSTGFIGTALVKRALLEGNDVYAVCRPASANAHRLEELTEEMKSANLMSSVHVVECPLDKMADLPNLIKEKCDIFYHIGWANTGRDRNASADGQQINVQYTRDAVKAAKALGCKKFLGAGSQAEYGPKNPILINRESGEVKEFQLMDLKDGIPDGWGIRPISPSDDTEPTELYGKAKLEAMYAGMEEAKANDIEFVWARIFSTYGVNDKLTTMISEGIQKMLKKEQPEFSLGYQIWDYMYVDDMANALYLAGKCGKDQAVYCLGSGQGRQLREYIEIMRDSIDPSIDAGIGLKPYPNGVVRNICADISTLTEDTGFKPKVSFEDGIILAIEDIRKRIGL